MFKNMGGVDRGLRLVVAGLLVALIARNVVTGPWAVVAGLVAAVMLLTALFGVCPLYRVFGMSTGAAPKRG
jgi:hypothetical protein